MFEIFYQSYGGTPLYQIDPFFTAIFLFFKSWYLWVFLFAMAYILAKIGKV